MKTQDYFNVPTCIIFTSVSFGLGTVPVKSLDCELLENIYFYVYQLFILKGMLR